MAFFVRPAAPFDAAILLTQPAAQLYAGNSFLIALEDTSLAAFLAYRRIALDQTEILHLETLLPFQRQGAARQLLQYLLKQNLGDVFLEVRAANQPARNLYDSEGFTKIGVRKSYYSDPPEDGIVLKFHPC